jgi:hypothetical protein
MIGYDIYDRFTMEHFPLRQRMTLITKIYCSRLYLFEFALLQNICLSNDSRPIDFDPNRVNRFGNVRNITYFEK